MKLSKNFTLSELIKSDTATRFGIDNTPPQEVMQVTIQMKSKNKCQKYPN